MFPGSQQTACVCLNRKTTSPWRPASPRGQLLPSSTDTRPDARTRATHHPHSLDNQRQTAVFQVSAQSPTAQARLEPHKQGSHSLGILGVAISCRPSPFSAGRNCTLMISFFRRGSERGSFAACRKIWNQSMKAQLQIQPRTQDSESLSVMGCFCRQRTVCRIQLSPSTGFVPEWNSGPGASTFTPLLPHHLAHLNQNVQL